MGFLYSQLFVTPPYPHTDFSGQTIIVTGANVGLGRSAASHFVRLGATKVILGVRSIAKGKEAQKDIEQTTGREGVIEVWEVDLAKYDSVKKFAEAVGKLPRVDAVVENAAIATGKYEMFEDNESTITVNVTSTFLMALLLIPILRRSAKKYGTIPRLSLVTSEVHGWVDLSELDTPNIFGKLNNQSTANMMGRYPVSKLLEVFGVRELAPLISKSSSTSSPDVVLNMINPGLCHSQLGRNAPFTLHILKFFLARTTEVGSRTLVHAAAGGVESHGQYFNDGYVDQNAVASFVSSEKGQKIQKQVWSELIEKLEKVKPGIMDAIL